MKSQEYVERYGDDIYRELRNGKTDTLAKVFHEVLMEMEEKAKTRNVGTMTGLLHVIDEQNEKWNAFARKFNKKYGDHMIKMNAVLRVNEEAMAKLDQD